MKTIDMMTHEEVIALEPADIERLVRWACADEGIALPGPAPEKPETPKIERDQTVYKAGAHHFTERDAAEDVGKMLALHASKAVRVTYDWNVSSEAQHVETLTDSESEDMSKVTTERVLSKAKFERVRFELSQHKQREKNYTSAKKEYDAAQNASGDIRDKIEEVYNAARARQMELEGTLARFAEYLDLAGGSIELARKFYDKANKPSDWVRERLDKHGVAPDDCALRGLRRTR